MNRIAIFILTLYLQIHCCISQDSIPLRFNYSNDIIVDMQDWGYKCISWNNGIIFLGNGLTDTTGHRSFTLIYYDTLGNKLWDKVYNDSRYPYIQGNEIIALDDNSFYVGGIINNVTLTPWDRFLAKFNIGGDTIFFKAFIDFASNYLVDMEKYSSDTLMLLSAWQEVQYAEYCKIVIDLADTNGNLLYTIENEPDIKYHEQIIKYKNSIYVGGTKKTSPGSNYHEKVFINRYDLNLNYLGSTTPSLTLNEVFRSLTVLGENLYLTSCISTYYPPDPRLYSIPNISKLNESGDLIDTNSFGPASAWEPPGAFTINVGDQLLATCINFNFSELYFFDPNLNPLCNYLLKRPSTDLELAYIWTIVFVPPNKIAGTGPAWIYEPAIIQDQWNLLTDDVLSYVYTNCSYVENEDLGEISDSFHIWPTISDSKIFIRNQGLNHDKVNLQIFDINGRKYESREFYNETDIDVSGLAKGFYLLLLSHTGTTESHKFIVN